jgi:hypothetical protein
MKKEKITTEQLIKIWHNTKTKYAIIKKKLDKVGDQLN